MKSKDIIKIINSTLEQLESNAETCLMEHDAEHAQMYLDYATGVRMVLDNIKTKL